MKTVAFEQAAIKVEKAQEFAGLQGAIEQAFLPEKVEQFLKQLDRKGIRVRDFDAVLAQRVLEGFGEAGHERAAAVSGADRCPTRRRCASFTCRSWKASTSRCGTSLRSFTSTTEFESLNSYRRFKGSSQRS